VSCASRDLRHPWGTLPWVGAAVVALALACHGPQDERSQPAFTASVRFTRAEYDAAPRLELRRMYAICEGGEPAVCQFRGINVAALGPGRRVMLDQLGGVVQMFDSTGRWTRSLGRLGAGPGEYRRVMTAGFDSVGGVVLFDQSGFRIVSFDSLGRPLWTRNVPFSAEFNDVSAKGGRVVKWLVPGSETLGSMVASQFVLVDSAGGNEALASVVTKALRAPGSDLMPLPPLFWARPVWDVGPGLSVVFSPGDRMRIERYRGDGAADLLVEGDVPLRAVTSAEVARKLARSGTSGSPAPGVLAAQLREAARNAAPFHPAITDLAVLGDGSIWAKGSPASESDSTRYDVFSRDGRLTGYVMLPAAARVVDGDATVVLVTAVDGAGAPFAAVYRR